MGAACRFSAAPIKSRIHHPSLFSRNPPQLCWVTARAAASGGLGGKQAPEISCGAAPGSWWVLHGHTPRTNFWLIIIWTLDFVLVPAAIFHDHIPSWELLEVCKSSDQAREPEKSNALHPPFVLKLSRFYITQLGTNPGKTSATIISRENVAFLSF